MNRYKNLARRIAQDLYEDREMSAPEKLTEINESHLRYPSLPANAVLMEFSKLVNNRTEFNARLIKARNLKASSSRRDSQG